MAKNQRRKWFRGLGTNVVSSLLVLAITAPITAGIGFFLGQRNLATEVAEGLALLDLDSTSESLQRLVTASDHALSLLPLRTLDTRSPSIPAIAEVQKRLPKIQTALSEMKREASTALAALNSRRDATLATLKRFGKKR